MATGTVYFNPDGGVPTPSTVSWTDTSGVLHDVHMPDDVTKSGYALVGWSVVGGSGYVMNPGGSYAFVTGETKTVKAIWSRIYTVTFNSHGGSSVPSQQVTENGNLDEPTSPTRANYTFAGWWSAESGGDQYVFPLPVTSDMTLHAHWAGDEYNVTLDPSQGSGGTASVTATYGSDMPSPITIPTRTGYTFGGYYTERSGGGTQYYKADGTSARVWNKAEDVTLYAKWTANKYTVTLGLQGGYDGTTSVTATYGDPMPTIERESDERPGLPKRTGYTFQGYYSERSGGGTQYYKADGTSALNWNLAYNMTLYAYWTPNTYTVHLGLQGGTGGTKEVENVSYGEPMPSITIPTREGYAFGGYFTGVKGNGTKYYDANGTSARDWDFNHNNTLYAYWTPKEYDLIVYPTYGDNVPTIAQKGLVTGTDSYNNITKMSRIDHALECYWDSSERRVYDGDGKAVDGFYWTNGLFNGIAGSATSLTVYAHWVPLRSVDIKFRNADGSALDVSDAVATISYSPAPDGEKDDHIAWKKNASVTFTVAPNAANGWLFKAFIPYNSDTNAQKVDDSVTLDNAVGSSYDATIANLTYNATLYFVFEKKKYDVSVSVDEASTSTAGSVSVTGTTDNKVEHGGAVTFSATPSGAYVFWGWYDANGKVSSENPYAVSSVTSDLSLRAKFGRSVAFYTDAETGTGATVKTKGKNDDNWTVKGNGDTHFIVFGDAFDYGVEPNEGSYFDAWYSSSIRTGLAQTGTLVGAVDMPPSLTAKIVATPPVRSIAAYAVMMASSASYDGLTLDDDDFVTFKSSEAYETVDVEAGSGVESGSANGFECGKTVSASLTAKWRVTYDDSGTTKDAYFYGWADSASATAANIVTEEAALVVQLNDDGMKRYAVYSATPRKVAVTLGYAEGSSESMGNVYVMGGEFRSGRTWDVPQGNTVEIKAGNTAGYKFVGWYTASGLYSADASVIVAVQAALTLYAAFAVDEDNALFEWEGGTDNKIMEWRSKTYALQRPMNPSAIRVDSLGYNRDSGAVVLKVEVDMFSAPDAEARETRRAALTNVRSQTVRRLPMMRPERYMQVRVENNEEVDALFVGTSAGGLAV